MYSDRTISHKECLREADAVWSNAESICGDECRIKVMKFLVHFLLQAQVSQTKPPFYMALKGRLALFVFSLSATQTSKDQ